jgi:hypothetical protein
MTLPTQREVEIPLLEEIGKAGGKAKPKELYARLTARFPQITQADLQSTVAQGHSQWNNRIQWVRQALLDRGQLDGSVRGIWAITETGRRRLEAHRQGIPEHTSVTTRPKWGRPRKKTHISPADHDQIARALEKIGEAFGFDTLWKPKVNALRPDGSAIKAKRKTLDVAWKIANLTWVPIEVQVKGSVPDLIYRFQQVHQWSVRLVVVTVPEYREEIKEAIRDYPFRDKMVLLDPSQVLKAVASLDALLVLKNAIFE